MAGRRGYKVCPECEGEAGVRTKVCACGHVFVAKVKAKKAKLEDHRIDTSHLGPLDTLKFLMTESKTTEAGLKQLLGVRSVTQILSGEHLLNKAHAVKLAAHFGLEPGVFLPKATVGPPPVFKKAAGPPAFKPKAKADAGAGFYVVRLTDQGSVEQFIADLKGALHDSKKTHGAYSAFVHPASGPVLQVEIHLSIPEARKK